MLIRDEFYTFNLSCPWNENGFCTALIEGTLCQDYKCGPLFFIEKLIELNVKESSEIIGPLMLCKDENETFDNKQP